MNAPLTPDWTDANQAFLVAEFARLKARLMGETPDLAACDAACQALPDPAAIDRLTDSFGLSGFERDLLLLCAGVELDGELARQCAVAQGQTRPTVNFHLALGLLDEPHWSAMTPLRPLREWRLLDMERSTDPGSSPLHIDERILHYLTGINYLDPRLEALLRPVTPPPLMAPAHSAIVDRALETLERMAPGRMVLQLHGDDRPGQEDTAATLAARLGLQLYALDVADIPAEAQELAALATLWQREAALLGAGLLIEADDGDSRLLRRLLQRLGGLVLIRGREPQALDENAPQWRINRPGVADQQRLWQAALGAEAKRVNGALTGIAAQFQLSARQIHGLGERLAPTLAQGEPAERVLWSACRASTQGSALDRLAQRIEPRAGWSDIVLPEAQLASLRQIATQLRHRLTVHEQWGFANKGPRGLGISALFTGESGTGKTLAAEVIAHDLGLDLYRIDLSAVVSKFIGETEKNLRRVFDAAEASGAILLFDEADALFGKRSEVRDSHDRYANIEVSYLLQRMEAYRGLAILTTNHKAALDPAFQRRLRFIIRFPFPDQAQREAIWRAIFPAATPLNGLDYAKLARLGATGGSIHNIALNAAFLAAEDDSAVGMGHLLRAARLEAAKRDKPPSEAETRGWV